MAKKLKLTELTVKAAVGDAYSDAAALRDELQEWFDNLPENFQNGTKGEELQEAIDELSNECDNEPDLPEEWDDHKISVALSTRKRKSRATRLADCIILLDAVQDFMRGKLADEDEDDELSSRFDDAKSSWENVNFPGMY